MTTSRTNRQEPLIIERTLHAPVEQVWFALTDVEAIRSWYFELKEFKPEVGFEFQFVVEHAGNVYDHRCKITEVIPHKKLAYTWCYAGFEGSSEVSFELFPEGSKTRVKLKHAGIESFPVLPDFGRESFTRGWTYILGTGLKEHVEKDTLKLVVKRDFNAPLDLVWGAWTEPVHVKQWLGGDEEMKIESVSMDLRVGGKFRIQMQAPDGEYFTAAGTYLEVKPNERLVYTWDWEKDGGGTEFGELDGNETQVTVEFTQKEKQTEVVLTHVNFATEKSRDNHEGGWTKWLEKAAKFAEATTA